MLFKIAGCQQKWTSAFLSHHFKLDRILYAYNVLAAKTLALKVIIEACLG